MNPYLFYAISAVVVLGALGVVRAANIFHAGLSLALTFGAVAAVYGMLDAHFIAVVQVLIYVGAIAVILKFAVMLTQHIGQREPGPPFARQLSTLIGVAIFAALVLIALYSQTWPLAQWDPVTSYLTVKQIGRLFLTTYVVPFEMVGVLLLMALIGAVMVASKEEKKS
jgi:NADH-quinone oxidoreductase subunit J